MTDLAALTPSARFKRFVSLGVVAASANWLARFPLEQLAPFAVAVAVAYMVGMVVAFILFRRFVFPASPRPIERQIKFFVLVNIAGVIQVWFVSIGLVYYLFPTIDFVGPLAKSIGHGVAIGVPTISSYFGHRYLTFK